MKYKCLIFDHDDTTVNSTATIHYPCYLEYMTKNHPDKIFTLEEYLQYNFYPGVVPFFRDICGLSEEELVIEQNFWVEYAGKRVSEAFSGIRDIMVKHKAEGGILAVVSHSFADNILRDYVHNDLPHPDRIFGWEQPREERKPSPVPIQKLMAEFHLKPEEILVIDDLRPGFEMARAAGVDFAAAAWCYDIPENAKFMRENADYYCKTVEELKQIL